MPNNLLRYLLCTAAVLIILASSVHAVQARGEFDTKVQYKANLAPGVNSIVLDNDETYVSKLTLTARKAAVANLVVYNIYGEPIQRYQIPRTTVQYFAIEDSRLKSDTIQEVQLTLQVHKDDISTVGPSQLSVYVFDPFLNGGSYKRATTQYLGLEGNIHTFSATTDTLGYYALALLDDDELVTDTLVLPETAELSQPPQDEIVQEEESEPLVELPSIIETDVPLPEPEIQSPQVVETNTQPQNNEDALLMFIWIIAGVAGISLIAVGTYAVLQKGPAKPIQKSKPKKETKKEPKKVAKQEPSVKSVLDKINVKQNVQQLKKEMQHAQQPNHTNDLKELQKQLKQKYTAPKQPTKDFMPSPDAYFATRLSQLQQSLNQLDTISKQTTSVDSLQRNMNALHPDLLNTYAKVAADNGKKPTEISSTLNNVGIAPHDIKKSIS